MTSKQLHRAVSGWSCRNNGLPLCWWSDCLWKKTLEQVASLKDIAIQIVHKSDFKIQKWYWNVLALEGKELLNQTD